MRRFLAVSYTHLDVYKRQAMDLPTIIDAPNVTQILRTGAVVTLDANRGIVCCNDAVKE